MNRPLLLAALFVASLSLALSPPASAQMGGGMWGSNRSNDLDIQKQRDAQMARRQKYAAPVKPRSASKPPALTLGTPGPYGRVDLSGRPAPGYATIRDHKSPVFGPPRHAATRSAPSIHAPRASTPARAFTPTRGISPARRIPPPPPIP